MHTPHQWSLTTRHWSLTCSLACTTQTNTSDALSHTQPSHRSLTFSLACTTTQTNTSSVSHSLACTTTQTNTSSVTHSLARSLARTHAPTPAYTRMRPKATVVTANQQRRNNGGGVEAANLLEGVAENSGYLPVVNGLGPRHRGQRRSWTGLALAGIAVGSVVAAAGCWCGASAAAPAMVRSHLLPAR